MLEMFTLGQSSQQEFSFLMAEGHGISTDVMNDFMRRSGVRQGWWMAYFGAIVGGLLFVLLRDRIGLRGGLMMLGVGLATGALLGFILSRLGAS
jgi:hypothetical protein